MTKSNLAGRNLNVHAVFFQGFSKNRRKETKISGPKFYFKILNRNLSSQKLKSLTSSQVKNQQNKKFIVPV